MSIGWTYCSEMISAQHRFKLRTFASYSMGRLVMIGLSHLAGEWRLATFLHGALCCCTLLLILFLPESVIWLRRIGRTLYLITYVTIYNAIALTWEPSFVCASELMPTDVRAKTTALLALVSRVGNLIASSLMLFKAIHEPVIMWTVLASNIVVFIVTAKWLEETKNCNLEEVGKSEGTAEASSAKAKVAPMKIEKDSIPQSKSKNGDEKPAFKRVTE
ncbi:unnamed protein product [Heligmosomoides polygyrus]|uniref:MFS domain-containing protein n=1 Tax=Heligmosomoides polygyrus TaxID=6339 RepID=A0A3P7ZUC3_HELPZ|nr:unnamed protein product [Heligmosomoides polygyrus]